MSQPFAKLDELLMDDCHVRYALGLLKELTNDLTLRLKATQQSLSSRTRFLPTIGRPDELAAVEAVRKDLARATSAEETMEKLHALIDVGLGNELDSYVRSVSPAYVRGFAAINNLVEWPGMLDRLVMRLEALLHALVSARNMAASGYDWRTHSLSAPANVAIDEAIVVAQHLDAEIALVNGCADRHELEIVGTPQAGAVLPRVPVVGFQVWIGRVRALSIGDVQAEFNRIIEMCALLDTTGVSGLREATERVAATHGALSRDYLQMYLGQLRVHMDEHRLVPTQTTARIHRLQLQHFGAVNFPFDLG